MTIHDGGGWFVRAGTAFLSGAFGSIDAFTSATLVHAVPLIFGGLAVTLAFRAGIWNIGVDGQLLAGGAAVAAIGRGTTGTSLANINIPVELIAGVAVGGLWAYAAAWLLRRFGVLEVISTIMLNFIALHGVAYLVRGPLQEPRHLYPQTATLDPTARLPPLWAGTRLHWGFPLALLAAVTVWWVLGHTAAGFRVRLTGANSTAARSAGMINTERTAMMAFLWSGGLAGLAGATEVAGVTYALFENTSSGYGFTAIAVALLARLNPLGVIGTAILFGALEAGGGAMQRDAGVPSVIVSVIEAVLILAVVTVAVLPEYLPPSSARVGSVNS
ncbi:MAG: ABC transporter permease [Chloroflexota bacterium]